MTSAATTLDLIDFEGSSLYPSSVHDVAHALDQGVWESYSGAGASSLPVRLVSPLCILRSYAGTADYEVTLIQYGDDSDALIVVDFGEPSSEFPKDQHEVVNYLRSNGRPILARKLIDMLRNAADDPDEPEVRIVSLQQMARLLVLNDDIADPSIGPDRLGIIHAQWQILGDGVLVISFLGHGEILLVAQADEGPENEFLDASTVGSEQEILEGYGYLVPRRY